MYKIEVKQFTGQHVQDIGRLIVEIQNEEFGLPVTLEMQPDLLQIPDVYQNGNGNFWMATVNGELAGTIALLDIGNQQTALRKMFVKKAYRGSLYGVGQILLNTLLAWAKEKQVKEIYLGTTEKFLAAQRFYEKNGFAEVAKNSLPEKFPIMSVDVKFYKLMVDR